MLTQDLIAAYTNNADMMKLLSIIPFAGGYVAWIYYYALSVKDRKMAIPFFLYTFWFAHDATAAVVFYRLSEQHDQFWFFHSTFIALVIWVLIEIVGIYLAIRFARDDIWGQYYDRPVTQRQAFGWAIVESVMMFAIVNILRDFMEDDTMFKWFALTNAILAVGPFYLWRKRKDRTGSSIALAIIMVIVVANTFLPKGYGMFTTASSYFDKPWFYIAGAVFTAMSVSNLIVLLRLPPKAKNGKWQIW